MEDREVDLIGENTVAVETAGQVGGEELHD